MVLCVRRSDRTAELAMSLDRHLRSLCLAGLTSKEVTSLLTAETARWARQYRRRVTFEAPARVTRQGRGGRKYRGRLDLLCTSWFKRAIAIEIDRANKTWSVDKLLAEADAGNIALWVRWAGTSMIEVPAVIGLVDIRDVRLPKPSE